MIYEIVGNTISFPIGCRCTGSKTLAIEITEQKSRLCLTVIVFDCCLAYGGFVPRIEMDIHEFLGANYGDMFDPPECVSM